MNMLKRKWKTLAFVLVLGGILLFIARSVAAGPGTSPTAKDRAIAERPASPIGGGADVRADVPPDSALLAGNAMVEPAQPETKVAGQVAARIGAVLVAEGDRVERDAPLVLMDSSVEKAALEASDADLATAKATYARVVHGNRSEDIDAALADASSAKARADNSKEILGRTQKLIAGGAATPDDLDRAKNTAAADDAAYKSLTARARAMTAGSRYEDIAEAKAKVVASEARRDQARATVERLTVRAPIAGQVLRIKYREGEYYNPTSSESLVILGDTTKLRVRIDIDERDVSRVSLGARGFAIADAWSGRRFPGKVVEIGRRMGRKNVRTDDPVERIDTKILEVVLELEDANTLVPGLRVMGYLSALSTEGSSKGGSGR
jgi:HlyD family secretion protein